MSSVHQPLPHRPVVHQQDAPFLEVDRVSVRYPTHVALEDISFSLERGERVALVGPNGAGKSTLFRIISGLQEPSDGEVRVAGFCPGGHICIAYLPQHSQVDWNFPVSVADVVMMGRAGRIGLLKRPGRQDRTLVQQCMQVVGITDLADRQIGELSGGQQQRMFIARALAQEAELMLMDEPLTGLDVNAQEEIMGLLDELRQRGVTVMLATHDLNSAAEHFDRVLLLNGHIVGFGPAREVFTAERLESAYGGQLRLVETENGVLTISDTCCRGDE